MENKKNAYLKMSPDSWGNTTPKDPRILMRTEYMDLSEFVGHRVSDIVDTIRSL